MCDKLYIYEMLFKHNPLFSCSLRIAGLISVNSSKFGMVRRNSDGTPRAHQGVDLACELNQPIYAVEDGEIVGIEKGIDGYGYTITLKIKSNNVHNGFFAFYAHCSDFKVRVGSLVSNGDIIATTGQSGNAKGMNRASNGCHLHFELRKRQICGKGLTNRIDPLSYIKLK